MEIKYSVKRNAVTMVGGVEEGDLIKFTDAVDDAIRTSSLSEDPKTITIIINTLGGCAFECLAICDEINSLKARGFTIKTIGQAKVCSSGVPIWILGDIRECSPTTTFAIHTVQWGAKGSVEQVTRKASYQREINDLYYKIITDNSDVSQKLIGFIRETSGDHFFYGKEWQDVLKGRIHKPRQLD